VRVAEELEMDRTSLYRAINPMIRDEWIVLADGVDARSRAARVTRKGHQLLTRADVGWDKAQAKLLTKFGHTAYSSLMKELHRLADCVES